MWSAAAPGATSSNPIRPCCASIPASSTRTRSSSSTDPQSSPELAVGAHWDWFTARSDALDLSVGVVSFYDIGGNARARVESQSALRFEFLKDFYFSVNGYQSFDSDPPAASVKADYGVNAALGWKF